MQSSITNLIFLFIFGTISLAKEVDNVFTSLDSIRLSSSSSGLIPFSFYDVQVSWNIDADVVATGDTFSLRMPYVYQVRIYNSGIQSSYFDITRNGETVASCEVDNASGRSLQTTITCTVTADISSYTSLSGVVNFTVAFDNGGRFETMEAATHWVEGWNIVTFNDDLVNEVYFEAVSTSSSQILSRHAMRGDTFYYYASPENICGRYSIMSGHFTMFIEKNGYTIDLYETQAATSNEMNPFGMPASYNTLAGANTYLLRENEVRVDFGQIPRGSRFWMSTFSVNHFNDYNDYNVRYYYEVKCSNGRRPYENRSIKYSALTANAGGDGEAVARPVTITSTNSWSGCSTITRYTTGTDSTVSEIVRVPQSSCATSISSTKMAVLSPATSSPVVSNFAAPTSVGRVSSSGFSHTDVVTTSSDIAEATTISTSASTWASTFTDGRGSALTYEVKSSAESISSPSLESIIVESTPVSFEANVAANTDSIEFSDVYPSSSESTLEELSMLISDVEGTTTLAAAGITVNTTPGSSVDGSEFNSGSMESDHIAAGTVTISSQATYIPSLAFSEPFDVSSSIEPFEVSTASSFKAAINEWTRESSPVSGEVPTQVTSETLSTSRVISVTNSTMETTTIVSSAVLSDSSGPGALQPSLSLEKPSVSAVGVADLYTSLGNSSVEGEASQSQVSDHSQQSALTSHISSTSLLIISPAVSDAASPQIDVGSSEPPVVYTETSITAGYSASATLSSISSITGTSADADIILPEATLQSLTLSSFQDLYTSHLKLNSSATNPSPASSTNSYFNISGKSESVNSITERETSSLPQIKSDSTIYSYLTSLLPGSSSPSPSISSFVVTSSRTENSSNEQLQGQYTSEIVETDESTGVFSSSASVVSELTAVIPSLEVFPNETTFSEVISSSAIPLLLGVSFAATRESSTPDEATVLESHDYSSVTSDEPYMTTSTVSSQEFSSVSNISSTSSVSVTSQDQISLSGHHTVSTALSPEPRYFATATLSSISGTYSSIEMLVLDLSSKESSESSLYPISSSIFGSPLWLNASSTVSNNFLDTTSESRTTTFSQAIVTSESIISLIGASTLGLSVPSDVHSLLSESTPSTTDLSSTLTSSEYSNTLWNTFAVPSSVKSTIANSETLYLVSSGSGLSDTIGLESSLNSNHQALTLSSGIENSSSSTLHSEFHETTSYVSTVSEPTSFQVNEHTSGVSVYSTSYSPSIIPGESVPVSSESSPVSYDNSSTLSSIIETTDLFEVKNLVYSSTVVRSETSSSSEGVIGVTSTLTSTAVDETSGLEALAVFETTLAEVSSMSSTEMQTLTMPTDKTVSTLSFEIPSVSFSENSLLSVETPSSSQFSEELSLLSQSQSKSFTSTNETKSYSSSSVTDEYTLAPGRTLVTTFNISYSDIRPVSLDVPDISAESYKTPVFSSDLSFVSTTDSVTISSVVDIVTATSSVGESVESMQNSTSSGETGIRGFSLSITSAGIETKSSDPSIRPEVESTPSGISDIWRESSAISSKSEFETSVPSLRFLNSGTLLDPRSRTTLGSDVSIGLLSVVMTGVVSTSDDKTTIMSTPAKTRSIRSTISTAVTGGLSTSEVTYSPVSTLLSVGTNHSSTIESNVAVPENISKVISFEGITANSTYMSSDSIHLSGSSYVETNTNSEVETFTLLAGGTLTSTGTTSGIPSTSGSSMSTDVTIGLTSSGSLNIIETPSSRFVSTESLSYFSDNAVSSFLNSNSSFIPTQTGLISTTIPTESYLVSSPGRNGTSSESTSIQKEAITSSETNYGTVITPKITHISLASTATPSGDLIDTSYYNSEGTHSPYITTVVNGTSSIIIPVASAYTDPGVSTSSSNSDISLSNGDTDDSVDNIGINSANDFTLSLIAEGETSTSIIPAIPTGGTSIYFAAYSNTGSTATTTLSSLQTAVTTDSYNTPSSSLPFALGTDIPLISVSTNAGSRAQATLGGIITMILVHLFVI